MLISRASFYWDEKRRLRERYKWFDRTGNKIKQFNFGFSDGYEKSYVWYDTTFYKSGNKTYPEDIIRVDSFFNDKRNKLKQLQYTYYYSKVYTEMGTPSFIKLEISFNRDGSIQKEISDLEDVYSYLADKNGYYVMRANVPIEYAEWMGADKTFYDDACSKLLEVMAKSVKRASKRDSTINSFKIEYK